MTPAERAEWLLWRSGANTPADRPTLGATDCAVVVCQRMGWPSFRSTADLYKERWHGRKEEALADRVLLEIGQSCEPIALALFAEAHNVSIALGDRLTIPAYPWWRGSPDAAPVMLADRLTVVDAKTFRYLSAGHWYDAEDRPVWPPAYLVQLAQYALGLRAAGYPVEQLALAAVDVGDGEYIERTALLTDPVDIHLDPAFAVPTHEDGQPFTVEDLAHAALALSARFRADHLVGDVPPIPPDDGPVVSWWCAKPRPAKSSRPATPDEEAAIDAYFAAINAEKAAAEDKASARATLARSMSESAPVARILGLNATASISDKGILTIREKK